MIGGWVRLVFDKIYFLNPELTGACGLDVRLWIGRVRSEFPAQHCQNDMPALLVGVPLELRGKKSEYVRASTP
eukprot:1146041-Pelagomonas_calceolata.AAC.26